MTNDELMEVLLDKSRWTVTKTTNDLWSFNKITDRIKVGRHQCDWAIFKLGRNQGFYMENNYNSIPKLLVLELLQMLNKK